MQLATQMNHLPTFLDDSQAVRKNVDPAIIVYMAANGQSMGRGSTKGRRSESCWKTVCFVTGERPLETTGTFEGISSRILTISTSPFGEKSATEDVNALEKTLQNHYGHSGRYFIEFLQRQPGWIQEAKSYFNYWYDWIAIHFAGCPVMGRRRKYAAALLATAGLLDLVFRWPFKMTEQLPEVIQKLAEQQEPRDAALEAYNDLMAWVSGNASLFYTETQANESFSPSEGGERYGILYENGRVAVFGPKMKQLMQQLGHHLGGVRKEWLRRRWLFVHTKDGYQNLIRLFDKPVRVYMFIPQQ